MNNQKIRHNLNGSLLLLMLLLLIFYTAEDKKRGIVTLSIYKPSNYVMIEGEINKPGAYPFLSSADLPGLLGDARLDNKTDVSKFISNESEWESGISIRVSREGDKYHFEKAEMSGFHKVTLGIPVNINKESVYGLTAIPGIGKSLARTIKEERIKRNGFTDIEELKTLPGIGEKSFSKIMPYVRL